jgi:recombination protein RecT
MGCRVGNAIAPERSIRREGRTTNHWSYLIHQPDPYAIIRRTTRKRTSQRRHKQRRRCPEHTTRKADIDLMEKFGTRITTELPANVNAQKFIAGITTAIQKNPALLECTNQSLMSAVLMSAGFGLIPNTPLGHAWLLPYNEKQPDGSYKKAAQFQIGYQGWLALVRASGEVTQVQAQVVRKGDEFHYEFGLNQDLRHVPGDSNKDEDITHAYAYVKFNDGTVTFTVMTREQLDAIRRRSKAPDKVWKTDFPMMCCKTVVIRVTKLLPKGDLLARAIQTEYEPVNALPEPQPTDAPQIGQVSDGVVTDAESIIVSEQISEHTTQHITGATIETSDG